MIFGRLRFELWKQKITIMSRSIFVMLNFVRYSLKIRGANPCWHIKTSTIHLLFLAWLAVGRRAVWCFPYCR